MKIINPVRIGQHYRDLDKRRGDRVFDVIAVEGDRAIVRAAGARSRVRIALARFADEVCKYELVQDAPAEPTPIGSARQLARPVVELGQHWVLESDRATGRHIEIIKVEGEKVLVRSHNPASDTIRRSWIQLKFFGEYEHQHKGAPHAHVRQPLYRMIKSAAAAEAGAA